MYWDFLNNTDKGIGICRVLCPGSQAHTDRAEGKVCNRGDTTVSGINTVYVPGMYTVDVISVTAQLWSK